MRIAVLGCGSIGRRHLSNLRALGQFDLLAFDPVPHARVAVRDELDIACYDALDEVWERRPDVVFVTAPPDQHIPLALAAVQHSCHLFIEKPLSHALAGIDDLRAEIERRNLITMIGCNMRFHPGPTEVKRLLEAGAIGQVFHARIETGSYLPGWRPQSDYRQSYSASVAQGGAILDCIHEIDLALWYFGAGAVVGAAQLPAHSIGLEVEGIAEILLWHDTSVLSSIHLNLVQRDYRRSCQIIGSEGTLHWDFVEGQVRHYQSDGTWQVFAQPPEWVVNQMYVDELRHFLECVAKHQPTCCPLEQGLLALRVALDAKAQPQNVFSVCNLHSGITLTIDSS